MEFIWVCLHLFVSTIAKLVVIANRCAVGHVPLVSGMAPSLRRGSLLCQHRLSRGSDIDTHRLVLLLVVRVVTSAPLNRTYNLIQKNRQ